MTYAFYALTPKGAILIAKSNDRDHACDMGERVACETGINLITHGYFEGVAEDIVLNCPKLTLAEGIELAKGGR